MSKLTNFKSALVTQWEALSPHTDGSSTSYAFIDSLTEERGAGQHRECVWLLPRIGRVNMEGGATVGIEWELPCEVFIHRRDQTHDAFVEDVVDDIVTLTLGWSQLGNKGTGVYEASLQDPTFEIEVEEPERPSRAGGVPRQEVARITFNFVVLTGEDGS